MTLRGPKLHLLRLSGVLIVNSLSKICRDGQVSGWHYQACWQRLHDGWRGITDLGSAICLNCVLDRLHLEFAVSILLLLLHLIVAQIMVLIECVFRNNVVVLSIYERIGLVRFLGIDDLLEEVFPLLANLVEGFEVSLVKGRQCRAITWEVSWLRTFLL